MRKMETREKRKTKKKRKKKRKKKDKRKLLHSLTICKQEEDEA